MAPAAVPDNRAAADAIQTIRHALLVVPDRGMAADKAEGKTANKLCGVDQRSECRAAHGRGGDKPPPNRARIKWQKRKSKSP